MLVFLNCFRQEETGSVGTIAATHANTRETPTAKGQT